MKYVIAIFSIIIIGVIGMVYRIQATASTTIQKPVIIRSIDTMKYSRDLAREKMNDPSFDDEIRQEMQLIKDTGATHVAIDTPYDEEFFPMLNRWVSAARAAGLSVWFRGNFSGWEGWFGFQKIGRDGHLRLLQTFLTDHMDLFQAGDVFTPCPECENGGPGDPRNTGDNGGYNAFLIQEYDVAHSAFQKNKMNVAVYPSMNFDVAMQSITPETVDKIGGTILIDHYVPSIQKFSDDIAQLKSKLPAVVGIGEFGAPIPDINGDMTKAGQALFVQNLTNELLKQNIPIANYWTLKGSSTELVSEGGEMRPAYKTIQGYFKTSYVYGTVSDDLNRPVPNAIIASVDGTAKTVSDEQGGYYLFLDSDHTQLTVQKEGYSNATVTLSNLNPEHAIEKNIHITPIKPSLIYKIRRLFIQLNQVNVN